MSYRPRWLAEGVEDLLSELERCKEGEIDFDVVVVGTGYGGAVAAARLAQARTNDGSALKVCALERGQEYVPGTFPGSLSELPGCVRFSRHGDPQFKGSADGLFDFRLGADVSVLVGNGLGGGSLINANVAEWPQPDVFADSAWPAQLRQEAAGTTQSSECDVATLKECRERAEDMLGIGSAQAQALAKYRALDRFASAVGAKARPARIAVNYVGGTNKQGVPQKPCIGTGNCVTGCNNWAKNTLAMNYLPLAKRNGARLFVNTTVTRLGKTEGLNGQVVWQVGIRQTNKRHPLANAQAPDQTVRARHVVLAAGTLGSTEILLRSRTPALNFSDKLGERFSGNGDMISVAYGQRTRVNAAPEESAGIRRDVGPTITGVFEVGATRAERVTVEELGIPSPLRRVFEEIVTTGALPVRLARFDCSLHRPDEDDPAAVDTKAIEHTQIFAAMGDDGARGRLEMVDGWEGAAGDGAIKVEWGKAGAHPLYQRQDELLRKSESLGGIYLRSPLWQPLPGELSGILSGEKPEGKLLSVHPLGGCAMGENCTSGVVDHIGRVFDPDATGDGTSTHDGLLVLDGAIVPAALGINPLLTITALAERAIVRYAGVRGWNIDFKREPTAALPEPPKLEDPQPAPAAGTALRFAEKMTGKLMLAPRSGQPLDVALEVEFAKISDIRAFLRKGPHEVGLERAMLKVEGGEAAPVSGRVYWMERGRSIGLWRLLRACWTWAGARAFSDAFQQHREGRTFQLKSLWLALKLASNVGEVRYLRYEMELQSALKRGDSVLLPEKTRFLGLKTVQYVSGGNPWRQLSELKMRVLSRAGAARELGTLRIDLAHMVGRFAAQLQIERHLDQPSAFMDLASIGLFLARVVGRVHFWSFRLPEYEKYDPERDRRRMPAALDGLEAEWYRVAVPARKHALDLPLTRYYLGTPAAKAPVLLIHGFGSGGIQFSHPKQVRNLVRHLAESGYDVWVAELRTSIAVSSSFAQWTLDEVATEDIPAIVQRVLEVTGSERLDVVAHCIGSAMFCSAVLAGRLAGKVRGAALLQVGPLVSLSQGNRFRAYMAAALRRYMVADFLYSSVDSSADWKDALLDRILYTYPYPDSERDAHDVWPPWKRDTHIANCNRSAGVFGQLFQHENVDASMLDALGDLLGHTNIKTFEQTGKYAFSKRLTDYDGTSAYVSDETVEKFFNFPVLFLHGEKNDVFHPDTTKRSLKLLNDVFGVDRRCRDRLVLPGYGHLDPLIGRNAEADVFRHISGFLRAAATLPLPRPLNRHPYFPLPPIIGPVLGWTRKDKDRWIARVWCRTDDEYVYAHFIMAIVLDARGRPVPGYAFRYDIPPSGRPVPDLLMTIDVPLPETPDTWEILIAGAYASVECDTREEDKPTPQLSAAFTHDRIESAAFAIDPQVGKQAIFARPKKLRPEYVPAMLSEREAWLDETELGRQARRVCDQGYEARTDSILLSQALLEQLEAQSASFHFALGSCRYPAAMIDRERADATFGGLRALVEKGGKDAPAMLLLLGDQIYADATAGLFDPKDRRARFYDAYREVWTAPNAREVLRRLPTYMMLDDHEVCDDWHPEDKDDDKYVDNRDWGLDAFEAYQLALSPRDAAYLCAQAGKPRPTRALGSKQRPGYFYSFEAGGYGFFACDTRTERVGRSHIMSLEQSAALKHWLGGRQQDPNYGDRPKFIMSPSVVVPFLRATAGNTAYAARSDGWDGFTDSLPDLLGFLADNGIRNVIFLCGDPHLSMVSELRFDGVLRALCLVASPFYAPYPFANAKPEDYAEEHSMSVGLGGGVHMHYRRIAVAQGDSFSSVGVEQKPKGDGWTLRVQVHGSSGKSVAIGYQTDLNC